MNTVKSDMSDTYGKPDEQGVTEAANTASVQSDAGKWYGVGFQESTTLQDANGVSVPVTNEDRDNYKPGIYVNIVSGEPLFNSLNSAIRALNGFQDIKTHPLPRHIEHASC
jgi:hypothetical protein